VGQCQDVFRFLYFLRAEGLVTYNKVVPSKSIVTGKLFCLKENLQVHLTADLFGGFKLRGISIISTPGHIVVLRLEELKSISEKHGVLLLSTSKGFLTRPQAIAAGLGGVVIARLLV
jgi:ribosomal protein S8